MIENKDIKDVKKENVDYTSEATRLLNTQCKKTVTYDNIHKCYNSRTIELEELLMQDIIDKDGLLKLLNELDEIKKINEKHKCLLDEHTQNHPAHFLDVLTHSLKVVEGVPKNYLLRLTALLHDIGKPDSKKVGEDGFDHFHGHEKVGAIIAEKILRQLDYRDEFIKKVVKLIEYHDTKTERTIEGVKKMVNLLGGKDNYELLLILQRADLCAHSKDYAKEKLHKLDEVKIIFEGIKETL